MNNLLFLIVVHSDLEPSVQGPFESEAARFAFAKKNRDDYGDRDGLFPLDINPDKIADKNGDGIDIFTYSNGSFE